MCLALYFYAIIKKVEEIKRDNIRNFEVKKITGYKLI